MLSGPTIALNMRTCTRCVNKQTVSGEIKVCPVDGAACATHAQAGDTCPKKLHVIGEPTAAPAPIKPCKSCFEKAVSGAIGLAKAGAQMVGIPIDQAPRDVEANRLRICTGCAPGAILCPDCDCIIKAKVMIASEKCPRRLW